MANTLTAYTPEVWSKESVRILREKLVMAGLVRLDFAAELAEFGDTVNTRKPAKLTAGDVPTDGSDLTASDVSATNIPVTLNKHKHITFKITSREASRSFLNLVDIFLDPAMLGLANRIDIDLLTLFPDFTPNYTVASAGGYKDAISKCRTKLNKNKARTENRALVLSDDDEGGLSNLDMLMKVNESGTSDTLRNGMVGRYKGFDIYRASNVVSVGSPPTRYNIAFQKEAIALVVRVPANATDQTPGAQQAVQTDPDGGIALRSTISYQHLKAFAHYVSVDTIYGVKTLDSELGVVLRGTATL